MTFPAARREVAQIPVPQPRTTELPVEQVQRLAARATLGQPRLDVQAAVGNDALVLADWLACRALEDAHPMVWVNRYVVPVTTAVSVRAVVSVVPSHLVHAQAVSRSTD
jgi:hypothetical protein